MNERELLEDAAALWMLDRKEGALLLVLVAVAATARKRYPRPMSDREAFVRFVADESETITGMAFDLPVPLPEGGEQKPTWLPLSEVLYKYVRCHIVHEAALPPTVRITDPFGDANVMAIFHSDPLELPAGFVGSLAMAVQAAPENTTVFGGVRVWVRPSELVHVGPPKGSVPEQQS